MPAALRELGLLSFLEAEHFGEIVPSPYAETNVRNAHALRRTAPGRDGKYRMCLTSPIPACLCAHEQAPARIWR